MTAPTPMNAIDAGEETAPPGRRKWKIRLTWSAVFGLAILLLVLVGAAFAPLISPYDPLDQVLRDRLKPPGSVGATGVHWLGTDALGRDLLSRLLYGARISLLIGVVATIGQTVIGTFLGLVAGHYRGVLDLVIMRLVDMWLTIPFLALAIALAAVLGSSIPNIILVLIITSWVYFTRVVRAEVLTVRERNFIEAARALGAKDVKIILQHILPNVANSVLVLSSFQVARTILSEATLSFLGLGVQPPTPTWGTMVADGRSFVSSAWWISTLPGIAISLFVLSAILLGSWVRDILDPIRRHRVQATRL